MTGPRFLSRASDGATIAYNRTDGRGAAATPGVVFLPGFRSDMEGGKALALERQCRERGRAFLRFDYTGHGQSSGDFEDGTIGQWAEDAVLAISVLTEGPQVLVGSSMGGWIMMLVARSLPDRVAGLVGIAPAPDFTEDILMANASAEMRAALDETGVRHEASEYSDDPTPITRRLIEDGRRRLVLREPFSFEGPVRIIQGLADPDVPWRHALKIADAITGPDVEIVLVKAGDHRLSEPQDLARLAGVVDSVCQAARPSASSSNDPVVFSSSRIASSPSR